MAGFLRFVSVVYLVLIWLICGLVALVSVGKPELGGGLVFLAAIGTGLVLSIPAAILYAFSQIVDELRSLTKIARYQADQLRVMRNYYEPARLTVGRDGRERARRAVLQKRRRSIPLQMAACVPF